jgi:hypothetical protein
MAAPPPPPPPPKTNSFHYEHCPVTQSIELLTAAVERVNTTLRGVIASLYGSSLAAAKILAAKEGYERNTAVKNAEKLVRGVLEEIEAVEEAHDR